MIHIYFPSEHKPIFPKYRDWDNGKVRHILPTVNHNSISIKLSLDTVLKDAPLLGYHTQIVRAIKTDHEGRFWRFDITGLKSAHEYQLTLKDADEKLLCDSWPLRTFPHPDSSASHLTILAYTCAGGVQDKIFGKEIFLPMQHRHQLLYQALQYDPDLVIANGDHIYWDRKSLDNSKLKQLMGARMENIYGQLDLSKDMLSAENQEAFTSICDAQIAELYGCLFRSTPVFFIGDDHDLFENDEARDDLVSLPPADYMINGAYHTQKLYYPELKIQDIKSDDRSTYSKSIGINSSFGSIKYGNLFEALLFDAKRYLTLDGDSATMIPRHIEQWIIDRNLDSKSDILFHVPSSPFGYTAGKWAEWYPDIIFENQEQGEKFMWQKGWWNQHQRILAALKKSERPSFIIQGDLHNFSFGTLTRSGELSFLDNPIHIVGAGPLGTGSFGFPSAFRGTVAVIPRQLSMREQLKPLEKNGFTMIDIAKDHVEFRLYAWRPMDDTDLLKDNLIPIFYQKINIKDN